jgi:hypothetical protein
MEQHAAATANSRARFPSSAVYHYMAWLAFVFSEQYSVFIHRHLVRDKASVQPAWLSVHAAHRIEETQHLLTDIYHIRALDLCDEERLQWSKRFAVLIPRDLGFMFGIDAPIRLVQQRYPALGPIAADGPVTETRCFREILTTTDFRLLREAAPYLQVMADRLLDA